MAGAVWIFAAFCHKALMERGFGQTIAFVYRGTGRA